MAAEAKSGLKSKAFRNYAGYCRRIVADIFGIGQTKTGWSERETILGDPTNAALDSSTATKLKQTLILSISQGGFWDQRLVRLLP